MKQKLFSVTPLFLFTFLFITQINIAQNNEEAEKWDILQQIGLKSSERQKIAKILKEKFYGKKCKDVKEVYKKNVR